jgi:thioredoxin 1
MVEELTNETFQAEVIQADKPVLVDFWAPWCGPCRMMAPIFESVSQKVTEVKFCKINTDEYQELAAEHQITGIPCMILFKNGKEIDRFIGALSADVLEKKLKAAI